MESENPPEDSSDPNQSSGQTLTSTVTDESGSNSMDHYVSDLEQIIDHSDTSDQIEPVQKVELKTLSKDKKKKKQRKLHTFPESGSSSSYDLPTYFDVSDFGSFYDLPDHIRQSIFLYLGMYDLASLSQLNRTFHSYIGLILNSHYKLEVEEQQMELAEKKRLEHDRRYWFLTYTKTEWFLLAGYLHLLLISLIGFQLARTASADVDTCHLDYYSCSQQYGVNYTGQTGGTYAQCFCSYITAEGETLTAWDTSLPYSLDDEICLCQNCNTILSEFVHTMGVITGLVSLFGFLVHLLRPRMSPTSFRRLARAVSYLAFAHPASVLMTMAPTPLFSLTIIIPSWFWCSHNTMGVFLIALLHFAYAPLAQIPLAIFTLSFASS